MDRILSYFRCDSIADDPEKKRLLNSKMTMEIRFSKYRKALTKRNVFVDILAILFGIGSWIGVNSIYVQLPLLVNAAPEGWSLPSYLVIIIQLGNIGPLVYTLLQKFFSKILHDAYWIYAVFLIGSIAAILLAIFYDKTIYLFGSQRSIALLTLSFFLALIGCTSSVLFMPYMGRFKAIYLITYLIGEGLSGFLPSIIALIQGVGGNAECIEVQGANGTEIVSHTPPALFNTKVFFILVFITIIVSSIAFVLLNKLDLCKREYTEVVISKGNIYDYNKTNNPGDDEIPETKSEQKKYLSTFNYYFIIVLMIVVSMLGNGFFPSIQSYACLPYGNVAYHFTVTLSAIANPVACFLAVFLHHTSIRTMISLALVGAVLSCYVLAISLLSPTPPLMGQVSGEILIVSIRKQLNH